MSDKKPIELMIVYRSMRIGGIERMIINLLNTLDKEKFRISLVLFKKEGEYLRLLPRKIDVYELKGGNPFSLLASLWKLIRKEKPQTLLAYGDYPSVISLAAVKVLKSSNTKVVVGVMNLLSEWTKIQRGAFLRQKAIKLLYPLANRFVAVSKKLKTDLIENFDISPKKVEVINNFTTLTPKKSGWKFPKSEKSRILYMGRLVKQKRVRRPGVPFLYRKI